MWFFHRAAPPGETGAAWISQFNLTTVAATGVAIDVTKRLTGVGGLAPQPPGGLFITDEFLPGESSCYGGLVQATPDVLFGFPLSVGFDVALAGRALEKLFGF